MENESMLKFVNKIFESREKAHIFHFQIKSYETHMAMQAYYEGVIELLDELVETYQGKYSIIENYDVIVSDNKETDPLNYFTEFANFIETNRFDAIKKEDTYLHNIVDEILALTYKTLFKLKYLK